MSALADWLHVCRFLQPQDRGLLWLGMGLLRAHAQGALRIAESADNPRRVLQAMLADALAPMVLHEHVPWSPPDGWRSPVQAFDLLAPDQWLALVRAAFGHVSTRSHVRLRLARLRPGGSDDLALLQATDRPLAVSIQLRARVQPVYRRPLRVAFLPRAFSDHAKMPAADVFAVAADRANSDVLVHLGPLRGLLANVLSRPYACKTNMIVARQALPRDEEASRFFADLHYLVRLLHSNAVLLVAPELGDDEVNDALNKFAGAVDVGEPFDTVLSRAFKSRAVLWCSPAFANQRPADIESPGVTAFRGQTAPPGRSRGDEAFAEGEVGEEFFGDPELAPAAALDPGEFIKDDDGDAPLNAFRFLQQQSFRMEDEPVPARGGFRAHTQCAVHVRIGPRDERWSSLGHVFPDHLLPPTGISTLTVWLTEPRHVPRGVQGRLRIEPAGASGICTLLFIAQEHGDFDGRLTVMHHGRVLQTGRLVAKVLAAEEPPGDEGTPELHEHVGVSYTLSGLDARKNFDLAIVTNHGLQGVPRAAIYEGAQAHVTALTAASGFAKAINDELSKAARQGPQLVGGIEGKEGLKLLITLARFGRLLGVKLLPSGFERRDQAGIAKNNRIQIVHTRADGVLPLEFVYDHPSPDTEAALCPNWKAAIAAGDCPAMCELHSSDHSATHVCPMGFWGVSKVIERHRFDATKAVPDVAALHAEHSPASGRIDLFGPVVVAFSQRVTDEPRKQVQQVLGKFPVLKPQLLTSWSDWRSVVSELNPALIVSMPHADGRSPAVTLEIEGKRLDMADLTRGHVTASRPGAVAPVVMLIGCDIAQAADDYGLYIEMFRHCGAAAVVATVSTVLGSQAAAAAARLADTLFSDLDGTTTIGEALRDTRRQALLNGEVMPLALVAYGDADWELKTGG